MIYRLKELKGDTIPVPQLIFSKLGIAEEYNVRVALYVLATGVTDPEKICADLKLRSRISAESALSFWAGAGLLERYDENAAPGAEPSAPAPMTWAEIAAASRTDPMISSLIDCAQTGFARPLTHSEMEKLVNLYVQEGFAPETVMLCVAYVASRGKRTMAAVLHELKVWRAEGVETGEQADAHLKLLALRQTREQYVASLLGIPDSELTLGGRKAIARWYEVYGYDDAMVQEAAVPGLRHAEEEVRVRGIRCALAGAAGKDRTDAAAALTDARKKLADLLASSGRPADALEPHFTCRLCEDTGIVDGRTCSCVHKVMQQLRRSEIEALSSLSISSFDTMELRYYPARMDASLGEPVRSYMSTLLDDLRGYADEFDTTSESLMLLGNAGLGKTHAALAIAGEVLEKGFDVIYVSSPDFFSKLEALHFGSDPAGEEEMLLRTAAGADLLILDDLGSEFNSSFLISTLYSLLNNRLGAKLPTIVTTNITDGALLEKLYTEKISSRLSSFVPFLFMGDDIRAQKAEEA